MTALLVLATIANLALAALLVAVSGFIFGSGPEGMHGTPAGVAAWTTALVLCLAAPVAGILLRRGGRAGQGALVAWIPPLGALLLTTGVIRPY